jgi:hypothetical protein
MFTEGWSSFARISMLRRSKSERTPVSEPDFESQLAALYRDAPRQVDDAAFLAQVDARLDVHLHRRRWILTSLGMLGGAITLAAFVRLEANATLQRLFASVVGTIENMLPISWDVGVALVLVALLVLPAFMRAVIDPK